MEWIKAMTEEMKGPMRQHSDKTRQLVEKVDQKALEEVSSSMVFIVYLMVCYSCSDFKDCE